MIPINGSSGEPGATFPIPTDIGQEILLRPGSWVQSVPIPTGGSNPNPIQLIFDLPTLGQNDILIIGGASIEGLVWHLRTALTVRTAGTRTLPAPPLIIGGEGQQLKWYPGGLQRSDREMQTFTEMPTVAGVPIRYDIFNFQAFPVTTTIPLPGPWRVYDLFGAALSQVTTPAAAGRMTPVGEGSGGDPLVIPDGGSFTVRQLAWI